MVHEVPDQEKFFKEIFSLLKPEGKFLLIEPKLFHVSRKEFEDTIKKAEAVGFKHIEAPELRFSWSSVLKKRTTESPPDYPFS